MKRIVEILLILLTVVSLSACADNGVITATTETEGITIDEAKDALEKYLFVRGMDEVEAEIKRLVPGAKSVIIYDVSKPYEAMSSVPSSCYSVGDEGKFTAYDNDGHTICSRVIFRVFAAVDKETGKVELEDVFVY